MPRFEYRAVDSHGKEEMGITEARNPQELVANLRAKGLQVSSVKRVRESVFTLLGAKRKVSLDDLMLFNRQLASMVNTDLPLVPSLEALSQDMRKGRFKTVIDQVRGDIERGTSLTEALSKHPAVFSEFYLKLIEAGEKGGNLPGILNQLADYSQSIAMLKRKIREALIYPLLVILVAVAVLFFLVQSVIPAFAEMFRGIEPSLPPLTRFILRLPVYFPYLFLGTLGLIFLIWLGKSWLVRGGGLFLDRLKLGLPLFGPFVRNTAIGNFCRTLGILLQAGVPLLTALELAGTASSNRLIEIASREMGKGVSEGERMTKSMNKFAVFPHTLVWMLSVGEHRGKLDESLLRLAGLYREQIDRTLRRIERTLAPLCIVGIGLIVGSIIVALFQPLIQMAIALS
ncbi:MAG: type II secretion system F family protein [Nitrospirae bacterium]|nr:type II secretion system F family protein [Nitrospirota bacterium]